MNNIRLKTVKLLGRLMQPLAEEGVSVPEMNQILSNLKNLRIRGNYCRQSSHGSSTSVKPVKCSGSV